MLKNLLVIETAGVLAGPSVGMFFAELGARVIKVESLTGDATRQWKLKNEDPDSPVSAYFSSVNYGKEYLKLDLKSEKGRLKLDELLKNADVLITNHLERQAAGLGLTREHIRSINPALIHGHIKGFAETDEPAYDVVLQAETGYISMTGTGNQLAKMPIAMIDVLAGHQLKEGILVALINKKSAASGAYVEVSLEETALSGLANQASNYLMAGAVAKPMGTLHPNIVPYGNLFGTSDGGKIILACGSDAHFQRLCDAIGLTALLSDPKFTTNQDRLNHRDELHESLAEKIADFTQSDVLDLLESVRVPAGAVRGVDEFLDNDVAQGMTLDETIDGRPTSRIRGNAFRIEFYD